MTLLLNLIPALLPVLLFLGGLLAMDSFRLVGAGLLAGVLALGAACGAASYFLSPFVMDVAHLDYAHYSRFAAPLLEEALKAAAVILLFRMGRIGFLVDAAILGLGVGAGFALFENVYYALLFPDGNFAAWLARGMGTALMHGGVTAVFALMSQALRERRNATNPLLFLPGFMLAAALHMVFNQFTAWPFESAMATILALPLALLFLFDRSEHKMHDVLLQEYESHTHLLADMDSGRFAGSRTGRVITQWGSHRDAGLARDVFDYVRLHTQLVLAAEAALLARENGKPVTCADPSDFVRLHQLERRIGKSALLTLKPHLKFSRRELFELHRLEAAI